MKIWKILGACLLVFASCQKDSYYHSMNVAYPVRMAFCYADQTKDSLVVMTTDGLQISSNVPWITVPAEMASVNLTNYYRMYYELNIDLTLTPNNTGAVRTGTVVVKSVGDNGWDSRAEAAYCQFPWLKILRPTPQYTETSGGIPSKAVFEAEEPALRELPDTLRFEAYGDWTLTDGAFVHPTIVSGVKGVYKVPLNVDENTAETERKEQLTLTSAGVSTVVSFVQKGAEKKENE